MTARSRPRGSAPPRAGTGEAPGTWSRPGRRPSVSGWSQGGTTRGGCLGLRWPGLLAGSGPDRARPDARSSHPRRTGPRACAGRGSCLASGSSVGIGTGQPARSVMFCSAVLGNMRGWWLGIRERDAHTESYPRRRPPLPRGLSALQCASMYLRDARQICPLSSCPRPSPAVNYLDRMRVPEEHADHPVHSLEVWGELVDSSHVSTTSRDR